jgi:hypothetical protein
VGAAQLEADTLYEDFQAISETVLAHHATKDNVEAELASAEDAGWAAPTRTTSATRSSTAPTRS